MSVPTGNSIILRGGRKVTEIDPADRALAYGDGVFETLLVHAGEPVWWDGHWQRLQRGAEVLGLALPQESALRSACAQLLGHAPVRCVLKIIVSRGSGGRGYRPPESAQAGVVLSWHPAPDPVGPVRLRWCELRWAVQPRLAGIKHLNRLEQVLARAEWSDPEVFDGLALDTGERVVSATSGNVFVFRQGRWLTPPVHRSGIAGLARAWVLENEPAAIESDLSAADVEAADAVFLCNAVRGILPVRALGTRTWSTHPAVGDLARRLASAHPAFVSQET